ncbi:HAD family hydrolase [Lapidilactobacillus dextrinicus]|uniref:HAD family hydrolase n=1 Tax=Lapidilactobacillus dextrinicus TaxID=51664 RepID=UPI003F22A3A7
MKALISDLDGTLLDSNGEVSPHNLALMQQWTKENMFIVASGRSYYNIKALFHSINFDFPIVALNGAIVFDSQNKVIFKNIIQSESEIDKYINFCEKYQLIYTLYSQDESYTRFYSNAAIYRLARARSGSNDKKKITHNFDFYTHELYEKSHSVENYNKILEVKRQILKLEIFSEDQDLLSDARNLTNSLNVVSSSPRNIEITEPGSSKGEALLKLAEYYQLDREHLFAIGDGENDLSMFKVVGTSIAMDNAKDIVKEQSTFVTKSNIEDGVAHAIDKIIKSRV